MSDTPRLKNIRNIDGGSNIVVRGKDDVINVDTSVGGLTKLTIPNIKDGGLQLFYKDIFVNDTGGQASTNKIRIATVGGDTINGAPFIEIETDSASVQLTVCGQDCWLAKWGNATSGTDQDDKVKVDATDALTQFLSDKLVAGDNVNITIQDVFGVKAMVLNASGVTIENTLYVSENGNDATAERNNMSKPYRTLTAARADAQAGDLVFTYAGLYPEGFNFWVGDNVHYYFEPNALVTGFRSCISDEDGAKNIWIYGYGTFQVTNLDFTRGSIDIRQPSTRLYCRGKHIQGFANGIGIRDCDYYDIDVDEISAISQYPCNINGNGSGVIVFNLARTQSTGTVFQLRALGTDRQPHKHKIIGKNGARIEANSQAFGSGLLSPILNGGFGVEIEFHDIEFVHNGGLGGGLMYLWDTGRILFKNCSGIAPVGYGVNSQTGFAAARFENCNFGGANFGMNINGDINVELADCQVFTNPASSGNAGVINTSANAELDMNNTTLVQGANFSDRTVMTISGGTVRMRNCKLIADDGNDNSIDTTGGARTIYLEGNCVTNKPVSADVTNGIAGAFMIVDPNVARNSETYYNP